MKIVIGIVIDLFNEFLIGVFILVKGIFIGVVIDMDGKYFILVMFNDVFVFLYVGYEKQEIKVGQ